MAVDKPTYGVLPPPTGLECEALTVENKEKKTFYIFTFYFLILLSSEN